TTVSNKQHLFALKFRSTHPEYPMNRLIFLLLVASIPTSLLAQFSYAPVNVPGAAATQARGINNNGEIVGFYQRSTCIDNNVVPTCPAEGFKYVNGSYI